MRRIILLFIISTFSLSILTFSPVQAFSEEETKLPELPNSSVSVPWSDFKDLIKKLLVPPEEPPEPPLPPIDYSISESHYAGRLEGESAVFDAEFAVDVLAENKWIEVPILSSSLAVSDVTMDGKGVTLRTSGSYYYLIMNKPGRHILKLTFYKPVDKGSGKVGVNVPIPMAPVSTLEFSVPKPGMDFTIDPANYKRTTGLEGSTRLEAALPVTSSVSIYWSPAVPEEISGELRVMAKVNTLISVGEGFLGGVSTINYEILHKSISTFSFLVPKDIDIIDVKAEGIRDWEITPEGEKVKVTVNMSFEVSGDFSLAVIYEKNMGDTTAQVDVPEIEVLNIVREQGFMAVTKSTEVEVVELKAENLSPLDVTELPGELISATENSILYSYKYLKHPFGLRLDVTKNEDEEVDTCVIIKEELTSLLTVRGDLVTRARFTVRNTTEQFLKLKIDEMFAEEPAGEDTADEGSVGEDMGEGTTKVWSAFVSDKPVKLTRDRYGRVLIPLDRSVKTDGGMTSFVVEMTYSTETKPFNRITGWRTFYAPKTDYRVGEMTWTLYLPKKYVYRNLGKDMELISAPVIFPVSKPGYDDTGDMGISTGEGFVAEEEMSMEKKEYAPAPSGGLRSQTEMNVIRDSIDTIGGKSGRKRGVLPVRVDIPFSGYKLDYNKTIVKKGEESIVKFRFQGMDVKRWISYIEILAWATFFATLLFAVRSARKRKRLYINKDKSIAVAVSLGVIILLHLFFILDFHALKWGLFWGLVVGLLYYLNDIRHEVKKRLAEIRKDKAEGKDEKSEKDESKKRRTKKDEE
ncbi:MAG: hypothetical protein JW984_13285 [Deltaproteobacteria bacterium]|uniref:Dolichyl-diphosphooligosaccharide--protein glycosyltransferase subunit 2 n=1 Tax=Candidatus Zymogenus saltonus TaxID=2844893 RepID=A0A9D8KGB8_9DELT|nr:hypothetical protein [Candidatus Zymogenus saltonus]